VTIAILVYGRTHSPFLTALAYALTYLPPTAGGPLLSGLADLFPRRRLMIVSDLFRVGTVGLMAVPGLPFCRTVRAAVLHRADRRAVLLGARAWPHCTRALCTATA
jgi:MFS family permease